MLVITLREIPILSLMGKNKFYVPGLHSTNIIFKIYFLEELRLAFEEIVR